MEESIRENFGVVVFESGRNSMERPQAETSLLSELNERSQRFMKPTEKWLDFTMLFIAIFNLGFNHNSLLGLVLCIFNFSVIFTSLKIWSGHKTRLVDWLAIRDLAISYGIISKYAIPINTNYLLCIIRGYRRAKYGLCGPKTLIGNNRTLCPQIPSGEYPELP